MSVEYGKPVIRQEQVFLGKVIEFIDLSKIDKDLMQKFIAKPFKLDLSSILKEAFVPKAEQEKFSLMLEFKITIPMDYQHGGHLNKFYKNNKEKFYFYNNDITDEKFGKVSHQLIPGKTYLVKIWMINKDMIASSQEILALLKANKVYLTGAQGASMLWQEKRDHLPKGKWHISMDAKENLPVADGYTLVPDICCYSGGVFRFFLDYFEDDWSGGYCVIGFCEDQDSEA
jgi:hypothetical protein